MMLVAGSDEVRKTEELTDFCARHKVTICGVVTALWNLVNGPFHS